VAIAVKRLHDRNKSGWWVILFYFLPNGVVTASIQLRPFVAWWWIGAALGLAISLWGFIELGFRRGTRGSNRFSERPMDEPLPTWNPNDPDSETTR
jgi:uncharacterized membrane protein YhaH (DUF805 family)